jgi:4-amino-4-deoxy-L-arabinose transferase-like glycosyltransferase
MLSFLGSIWSKINGYKTYIGVAITVVGAVASFVTTTFPLFGVPAATVAVIVGATTTILGFLHQAAKATGQE